MHSVPGSSIPLLTWPSFDHAAAAVALTTREGGVSRGPFVSLNLGFHVGDEPECVRGNRARVADAMGIDPADFVFCEQVHGSTVAVVDAEDRERDAGSGSGTDGIAETVAGADALVTTSTEIALAVMAADCAPLVFFDPGTPALGCAHAGWRGLAAGVIEASVDAMTGLGADPATMVVGIGPTASPRTYEVGEDVADAIRSALDEQEPQVLSPLAGHKYLLDLAGAARVLLARAGVAVSNIHASGLVTGADTPFYSHRDEGPCGRFALVARLLPGGEV